MGVYILAAAFTLVVAKQRQRYITWLPRNRARIVEATAPSNSFQLHGNVLRPNKARYCDVVMAPQLVVRVT